MSMRWKPWQERRSIQVLISNERVAKGLAFLSAYQVKVTMIIDIVKVSRHPIREQRFGNFHPMAIARVAYTSQEEVEEERSTEREIGVRALFVSEANEALIGTSHP